VDRVYGFSASASGADKLDLSGTVNIAPDTPGFFVDGIDAGSIRYHTIQSGVIKFYSDMNLSSQVSGAIFGDAVQYLSQNLTGEGQTVGFSCNYDGNGTYDFVVFQNNSSGDIVVVLHDIVGISAVSAAAAANTVWVA
jgi:hypothetical protein